MTIIFSQNGKNTTKLNKTEFGLENKLQQYIHNTPESIPLYDIKEDIQLLIITREFQTSSGPIDAIGIDNNGDIYLIETKLYKNTDKRTVVAQILDYGAALWKTSTNFDEFLNRLNTSVLQTHNQSIQERTETFFSITSEEVETILNNVSNNLNEGSFKFVILMDTLHDPLKDLILFINQNSKFDIYGVELEYYKHQDFEIVIPKLFGAEVKKDITPKSSNTFITNEEFIKLYTSLGYEEQILEIVELHNKLITGEVKYKGWSTQRTPKTLSFFYRSPNRSKKTLVISLGYNHTKPEKTLVFWLYEREIENNLIEKIKESIEIQTIPLVPKAKYGEVAHWDIKDFSKEKLLKLFASF